MTCEVGERFGLRTSSINKQLKQHGVVVSRRSPGPDEIQRAVELGEAGSSTSESSPSTSVRCKHRFAGPDQTWHQATINDGAIGGIIPMPLSIS
jgi:hypothetical protein